MITLGVLVQVADDEVHVWRADVASVSPQLFAEYYRLMSAQEVERNARFHFEKNRHCDALTRVLARTILSKYADVAVADWTFNKGEYGKPEIANSSIPLRFNLSHTSGQVVCAITKHKDIGIDIENTSRSNDVLAIADRYFSEREISDLFTLPEPLQTDRFFDYWTLKEAYMKARGEGISLGLGNFGFSFPSDSAIRLNVNEKIIEQTEQWRFWLLRLAPDHRLAIALKAGSGKHQPKLRFFETIPLSYSKEVATPYS